MNCKVFEEAAITELIITHNYCASSKYGSFCFLEHYLLLFWETAADMNFKVFVPTIYNPIIMLMPFAWWRHQNKNFFVWMLNASVYLINYHWHEFKFFVETTMYDFFRDGIIKIRKLLFIWLVIATVHLINFRWHEFLGF